MSQEDLNALNNIQFMQELEDLLALVTEARTMLRRVDLGHDDDAFVAGGRARQMH